MTTIDYIDEARVLTLLGEALPLVKDSVLAALRLHFEGDLIQPAKLYLQRSADAHTADRIIAMAAYINGASPMAGLKWIGSHPRNHLLGFERASALIILNDPATNRAVAVVEGSTISTLRTLAISLISMDRFCRQPTKVACVGMGKLGRLHALNLPTLYPSIQEISCFSAHAPFDDVLDGCRIRKAPSLQSALCDADVVITTTAANAPYITDAEVGHSKLLVNLSLMDLSLSVFTTSMIVVDDLALCLAARKVFREGVKLGAIKIESVTELSRLLYGPDSGAEYHGRVLVNPIGMVSEDLLIAQRVLERHRLLRETAV